MPNININGVSVHATQKTFPVYPDVTSFHARLLLADRHPVFLFDAAIDEQVKAAALRNGWTVMHDRLLVWRDATVSLDVLRQIFPPIGREHIRRNVTIDVVELDRLTHALTQSMTEPEADAALQNIAS